MKMAGRSRLWREIVNAEPRMSAMLASAKSVKDGGDKKSFCANRIWYDQFKPELVALVGFESRHPELRTMKHYDAAYEKVYAALPACRNCWCL